MENSPGRCKIHEHSILARMAARRLHTHRMAVTFGKHILLWNCDRQAFLLDEAWVRHELCHVRQFGRYGIVRFLCLYLWESFRHGYEQNAFEVEAREAERGIAPIDLRMF